MPRTHLYSTRCVCRDLHAKATRHRMYTAFADGLRRDCERLIVLADRHEAIGDRPVQRAAVALHGLCEALGRAIDHPDADDLLETFAVEATKAEAAVALARTYLAKKSWSRAKTRATTGIRAATR